MATSAEIRQQLVAALRGDLIGPGWEDRDRRHEQLSQPPSVWYQSGFLAPHVFQQEGRNGLKMATAIEEKTQPSQNGAKHNALTINLKINTRPR